MKKTVHVIISGRVQGVWFRATTKQEAEKRDIVGWVRNTSDGKVEAVFQGDDHRVDDMIVWCYEGPSLSHVDKVEVSSLENKDQFDTFKVRY